MSEANQYLRANMWPTGTRVQLLSVPWDSEYRDVVAWESAESRDKWFEEHLTDSWAEVNFNYLWPNTPVPVPVPYNTAYKYNYIAVTNPAQPIDDEGPVRTYYYFVTNVEYLSPQASNLTVQLDVMTTYTDSIELGKAFYDRGHVAIANTNATLNTLDYYLTLPEGLDVGKEYVPVHREFFSMAYDEGNTEGTGVWAVVVSTADLTSDPGSTSSPKLDVAEGCIFDGMPNGCSVYAVKTENVLTLMQLLASKSWVAQCIIDIYIVPQKFIEVNENDRASVFGQGGQDILFTNVRCVSTDELGSEFPDAVVSIKKIKEKFKQEEDDPLKLFTYPYSVIEVDNLQGNPVYLKPEQILGEDLDFLALGSLSVPQPKVALYPRQYQSQYQDDSTKYSTHGIFGGLTRTRYMASGSGIDSAIWFTDFPHISIVNNQYQLYLASTVNTRNYNYQSAGWTLDRANMAAQANYANTMDAASTAYASSQRGIATEQSIAQENLGWDAVQGGLGAIGSVIGSAGTGNVGGAVQAGVSGLVDLARLNTTNQQNMSRFGVSSANAAASRDLAARSGDRNKSLAMATAKGDYQNTIAGINATVQDAALTAPSVVGQQGGNTFNFKNDMVGLRVTWKTITGASRKAVKEYFQRYGCAIRRWLDCGKVRSMLCMSKFAYVKLLETTITCASANEAERQAIRGVFEKGVTLWDKPEYIGNTSLGDNIPRAGYRY